jgi:SAM-dependent methyltransferase
MRKVPRHLRRLALRFQPWKGRRLLDVACGPGVWLRAATELGAVPAGVDISQIALDACRRALPQAELYCGPAEQLPFVDRTFDFVCCLGALEHFLDPESALREMVRVARTDAQFLLLVPNADFPPARFGLYGGTSQSSVHEELRSLAGWQKLFESAGLAVVKRWRDLHVLSAEWINLGPWYLRPIRLTQALMLPIWPLSWQYQVYHYCRLRK